MVHTAVEEGKKWQSVVHNLDVQAKTMGCLEQGRFRVQTMDEAYDLALLIAQACPNSEKVAFGLNELIANAVEHGNLEIGYEEKTRLQATEQWEAEIARRLQLSTYAQRFVEIIFERHADAIKVTVRDQGPGFNWREYEEIKAERMLESHGRGIAMAKALSFDHLEYVGNGNEVVCLLTLPDSVTNEQDSCRALAGTES